MDLLEEKSVSRLALARQINTLYRRQIMNFTKHLFLMTSMVLPDITARTFSRYLGKSEGYYGSITAQNLDISTNSLLFLAEVLDHKNTINPNKRITELQAVIAQEVVRRMQKLDTENEVIRKLVIRSVAKTYMERDQLFSAPPIVICWGQAMRLHEIQTINPKSPEDLQADALKQRADKAADRLKVSKQQKRLADIQKSFAKLQSN
jgi:hypothetical protein